jgi:GntR family transcriptional repressor for pyruvate dehydrogenase complex
MTIRLSDKYKLEPPQRLPDQVAEIIEQEIQKENWRPGDKLPSEAALSRQFGVSRSVVREALSRLKYEGLLDSHQGKGIIVVGTSGRRSFRLQDIQKLDSNDLSQLYELRTILDSAAAAMAARRSSRKQLQQLKTALRQMSIAIQEDTDGTVPDFEFHKGIAEASGNTHLNALIQFLNDKIEQVIHAARRHSRMRPGLPAEAQAEHEAIYRALVDKNPEKARQAALTHLQNAAKRLGLTILEDG